MSNIKRMEREHLENLIIEMKERLGKLIKQIEQLGISISDDKRNLWENIYEMDPMEIIGAHQEIERNVSIGEDVVRKKILLERQIKSPFFARIDFKADEASTSSEIYIGVGTFFSNSGFKILVYDWRTPIASMFYDFELGEAFYIAPAGKIMGQLTVKRQYSIVDSKLKYMFESSINIGDEILQRCLSKSSSGKMGNIIATIQREQNLVIRNDSNDVVILQGVAGSGKTSIALHRAAYLLYKYKDQITSENILIISPNRVFANYIANVLPELGEENILECEMNQIVENELGDKFEIESSMESSIRIVMGDNRYIGMVREKSKIKFVESLRAFVQKKTRIIFSPVDIKFKSYTITSEFLANRYSVYQSIPPLLRINQIAEDIQYRLESEGLKTNFHKLTALLRGMFNYLNPIKVYEEFCLEYYSLEYFGIEGNKIEYIDSFAITYIKVMLEGGKEFNNIKHIIIDEMQDYPPICYELIKEMFKCQKTILGDVSQTLIGDCVTDAETIKRVFGEALIIELKRSYRSTLEIIDFAKKILPNVEIIPFERHGDIPSVEKVENIVQSISLKVGQIKKTKNKTLAIICKTQEGAEKLYHELQKSIDIILVSTDTLFENDKTIITSVQVSKGLEFDYVIIPDCEYENYQSSIDKNLLFVACTRAMHKLDVLYTDKPSVFIT